MSWASAVDKPHIKMSRESGESDDVLEIILQLQVCFLNKIIIAGFFDSAAHIFFRNLNRSEKTFRRRPRVSGTTSMIAARTMRRSR